MSETGFHHAARKGETRVLAEVRRIGTVSNLVAPEDPETLIKVNIKDRVPLREVGFAFDNYVEPLTENTFGLYLWISVFVTVMATIIALVTNSMAAFALSKYEFRGRNAVLLLTSPR